MLCLHLARHRGALRGRGMAPKAQPVYETLPQIQAWQDKSNHLSLSASLNFPTSASVCD